MLISPLLSSAFGFFWVGPVPIQLSISFSLLPSFVSSPCVPGSLLPLQGWAWLRLSRHPRSYPQEPQRAQTIKKDSLPNKQWAYTECNKMLPFLFYICDPYVGLFIAQAEGSSVIEGQLPAVGWILRFPSVHVHVADRVLPDLHAFPKRALDSNSHTKNPD